ncbi:MAG TPA: prepilin peptidase [Reyranella sp.]|nr:prepilin peptidase [Reyranella sp.]
MIADAGIGVTAIVFGACVGSFLSTVAVRAVSGQPWSAGGSRCDSCAQPLPLWRTVPLLSYTFNAGRCRRCQASIPLLHPIGELTGIGIAGLVLVSASPSDALQVACLGALLLAIALYDAATMRIPDVLTFSLALVGVVTAWAGETLIEGAIAATAGLLVLSTVKIGFRRSRGGEGLGWGDVKMVGALGLWLGAQLPLALAVASGLGLCWSVILRRVGRFPFGPFLAIGAYLVFWVGLAT